MTTRLIRTCFRIFPLGLLLIFLSIPVPARSDSVPAYAASPATASGTGSFSPYQAHLDAIRKTALKVGIQVVALPSGRIVWEHRSGDVFTPASVVKVLTSFTALKQLGPYHHFTTSIKAAAGPKDGVISGPIWVKGEGDIFLSSEKAWILASQLRARGVRTIQGGVYVDDSFFEPGSQQICLDGKCGGSYNPMLSATAMDFNTVTFRVRPASKPGSPVDVTWHPPGDYILPANLAKTGARGTKTRLKLQSLGLTPEGREKFQVSGLLPVNTTRSYEYRFNVDDPASFFARSFKAMLLQAGIEVGGREARAGKAPPGAEEIASSESAPLGDLLYGLNRHSNNFMAEMLLRSMGAAVMGRPGTVDKGLAVIKKTLRELEIPDAEMVLDCGSGLSRECRVSPRALCQVLVSAYNDFAIAPEFMASLAVNAREGTLKRRMHRPGIVVRGKTGTLNGVVGFSGYVSGPGGRILAVTVLLNEVQDLRAAREAVDAFVEALPAL